MGVCHGIYLFPIPCLGAHSHPAGWRQLAGVAGSHRCSLLRVPFEAKYDVKHEHVYCYSFVALDNQRKRSFSDIGNKLKSSFTATKSHSKSVAGDIFGVDMA